MKRNSKSSKMFLKHVLFYVLCITLLYLNGCVSTQLNLIRDDINSIKQEMGKISQENQELNQKIKRLESRIESLEMRIQAGETSLEEAIQELAEIRENLGIKAQVVAPAKERTDRVTQPKTAEDFYKLAYEEFRLENYKKAAEDFRAFIERFPNSGFIDVAQFWLGECYYAQGDWSNAIKEYVKLIELYPFGSKVPDAYLKLGFCHLKQDNKEKALENFQVVVDIFPHSNAAKIAQDNIRQLKKER